ncbi:unnamed protein product [Effrenium voratum]|nr:unnamed protein product [Effrenium voratum]
MTKSERLGQGQSLAARTKKAEEAFLARFRNPGRSKPPQRLPRRSQEHANLRARAEDSQDVQEQLDSVAAASGLPISDKVTHDTEIQSPIDGLKQECADRPALAELQNKTCDLSKASIKDLRKASVGHGEEELAEEFPKVAEEEDTITVLPPLPGDGHGAPTPGLDAVLQSALEQVVEEAKACFDEAPHSTDDAFPTGFLEEVLRRGTDRMLDSPTCERTRTWREIKGQQDEAVHGDNARDRRCAPELTRSQEDTCFVAKLLQEAEVALREGSNDSLLWDTAQSCTAVSCLPRTLCDSPKVCQERQTQPSNEDASAVPVEEALPLDDDMDQPKEEAVKTSPWTEQNHSPNISLEASLRGDLLMGQVKVQRKDVTNYAEVTTSLIDGLGESIADQSKAMYDYFSSSFEHFAGLVEILETSLYNLKLQDAPRQMQMEFGPLLMPAVVLVCIITGSNCYFGFLLASDDFLADALGEGISHSAGNTTANSEAVLGEMNILVLFAITHVVLIGLAAIYILVDLLRRCLKARRSRKRRRRSSLTGATVADSDSDEPDLAESEAMQMDGSNDGPVSPRTNTERSLSATASFRSQRPKDQSPTPVSQLLRRLQHAATSRSFSSQPEARLKKMLGLVSRSVSRSKPTQEWLGSCCIKEDDVAVRAAAASSSTALHTLRKGKQVEVVQAIRGGKGKVWGRIARPSGWVLLADTGSGYLAVVKDRYGGASADS